MRSSRIAAAFLLLVLLAGCSPGAVASPSSAAPTPQASETDGTLKLTKTGTRPLEPGTYTYDGFTPRIELTIGSGGWVGADTFGDFFDVQIDPGSPDVIAVQFAKPSAIFDGSGSAPAATTPEAAVAALAANATLESTEPESVTVDGRAGQRITVTAIGAGAHGIMTIREGTLSILADRRLDLTFIATESDGLLAIMVGGSVARWDAATAAAEPVVGSVRIGP